MRACLSFLDWSKQFEKKQTQITKISEEPIKVNSIGLIEEVFKEHLRKWREENL